MEILFISDYVCPYCLVAKEALRQALAETGLEAHITWQPYELTPPPKDRVDTYHDAHRREKYQILNAPCAQLGLDMKLPPNIVPRPYTRLAFQGWYYACDHGMGDAYNERMYRAYFIDELDIGDPDVLTHEAAALGLDAQDFRAALDRGTYAAVEAEAVDYARNVLQPKGVPTIYIDGQKIALQTFTREEMADILLHRAAPQDGPTVLCSGDSCTYVPRQQVVCNGDSCTLPQDEEEVPAIPVL